jgi:uncharacterized protein YjdB
MKVSKINPPDTFMRTRELTKLFSRPAAARLFARTLLALVLLQAACTEGHDASSPALNRASLPLRATYAVTPSSSAGVNRIRITLDAQPTGPRFGPFVFNVDPNQGAWSLPVELELSTAINVMVLAELINVTNNTETVQYSGRIGPIKVAPGETQQSAPPIPLYPGDPSNLDITSIQLTQPPAQIEGATLQLRASVQGGGASPVIVWRSLNPTIASVDETGVLHTLLPGNARIEARAGPKTASVDVLVDRRMDRVVISPATLTVNNVGAPADFTAQVVDPRGLAFQDVTLVWTVSDNTVADAMGAGKFRVKGGGRTTITATVQGAPNVQGTAQLVVDQRIAKIGVSPLSARIDAINGTLKFAGSARDVNDADVTNPAFKWTSSAPAVATIDQNGVATAKAPGKTVITAEAGGLSVKVDLEVLQKAVKIQVTPAQLDFNALFDTKQITANAVDANNFNINRPLVWRTNNANVVQVDANGVVTAVGNGLGTIVAQLDNMTGTATVKVQQLLKQIALNATSVVLQKRGDVFRLVVTATDANNNSVNNLQVTYTSADATVASVSTSGVVEAANQGQTTVTVSAGGFSLPVAVTVVQATAAPKKR